MEKSTKILILVAIIVVVIIVVVIIVVVVTNKKKSDGTTDDSPTVEPYRSTETFYHTNATDKFQAFIDSYIKGEQGIF